MINSVSQTSKLLKLKELTKSQTQARLWPHFTWTKWHAPACPLLPSFHLSSSAILFFFLSHSYINTTLSHIKCPFFFFTVRTCAAAPLPFQSNTRRKLTLFIHAFVITMNYKFPSFLLSRRLSFFSHDTHSCIHQTRLCAPSLSLACPRKRTHLLVKENKKINSQHMFLEVIFDLL